MVVGTWNVAGDAGRRGCCGGQKAAAQPLAQRRSHGRDRGGRVARSRPWGEGDVQATRRIADTVVGTWSVAGDVGRQGVAAAKSRRTAARAKKIARAGIGEERVARSKAWGEGDASPARGAVSTAVGTWNVVGGVGGKGTDGNTMSSHAPSSSAKPMNGWTLAPNHTRSNRSSVSTAFYQLVSTVCAVKLKSHFKL